MREALRGGIFQTRCYVTFCVSCAAAAAAVAASVSDADLLLLFGCCAPNKRMKIVLAKTPPPRSSYALKATDIERASVVSSDAREKLCGTFAIYLRVVQNA